MASTHGEPLTWEAAPLWYRPVMSARVIVDRARRGAAVLRLLAWLVAALAIIGNALRFVDGDTTAVDGGLSVGVSANRQDFGHFLTAVSFPLALAGVLAGCSFLLRSSAARLDLAIVLAHEQADLED